MSHPNPLTTSPPGTRSCSFDGARIAPPSAVREAIAQHRRARDEFNDAIDELWAVEKRYPEAFRRHGGREIDRAAGVVIIDGPDDLAVAAAKKAWDAASAREEAALVAVACAVPRSPDEAAQLAAYLEEFTPELDDGMLRRLVTGLAQGMQTLARVRS